MKNFAKRISALVLAVVVSAAVLCPAAFAAQLPSLPKDQCVVDDAGVLSSSTVQTITELNAQLESSCSGAQIGVLTVEYTGNDSTEDYATQAFNAWGIGSSSNNNGVLILLVMESAQYADGDYYLTYGDGFRNTTLAKQSSAIAQTMEDQFAAKDYDGAVTTCARNVANTIADIYGVSLSGSTGNGNTVQPGYQGGQSSGGSTLTDILTLVVSVVLLIVIIRSVAYVFASPCGWLWCFGGPRPPRGRRRGPHNPPPPPGGFYGGFGGMGGGSFGGGAGRGGVCGVGGGGAASAFRVDCAGAGGCCGAVLYGICCRICVGAVFGLACVAARGVGLRLLLGGFLRLNRLRNGWHRQRRADHGRARDRAEQVVKGSFHSGASR